MADSQKTNSQAGSANDPLQEVKAALNAMDKARARDLLTGLLKKDQQNAEYWVWLSAAVESKKETIFCLKTALRLDPENRAARKGLIFHGELPPDETIKPMRLPAQPVWLERVTKKVAEKEKTRLWANPLVRLAAVTTGILVMLVVIAGGSLVFNPSLLRAYQTPTRRPPVTLTFTPSSTPSIRTATPTFLGPTPLAFFLASTYTPTRLYVVTEHPVLTRASFDAGLRSLGLGNYETARVQFQEVLKGEPDAVDVRYYLGESYRLDGECGKARDAYQAAIDRASGFAPGYLGRALASLCLDRGSDVLVDLDEAIRLDGRYAQALTARAAAVVDDKPAAARQDLQRALEIEPGSAQAYLVLAQAELALGNEKAALAAAQTANRLDMTLVPVYLQLALAYIATGDVQQAESVLQTYTIYAQSDESAQLQLGSAYNAVGDFSAAVEALNRAIEFNPQQAEAYTQRGLAYLELGAPNLAETDLARAVSLDVNDFDAQLALGRAYFLQNKAGEAYIQVEQVSLPLARQDDQKAQAYYWAAVFLEAIDDPLSAAGARNYWSKLILLPEAAMPAEWRAQAYERLKFTPTATPTVTPRPATPTSSRTSGAATNTVKATPTATP